MKFHTLSLATFLGLTIGAPLAAQDASPTGDPEAGARAFNQCKSCHSIEGPDEVIARGGKVGPNLYGVAGRQAGTVEGFRYSDLMVAAGEDGLNWNEDDFVVYVQDPTAFLEEYTGESGRGKMTFKLRKEEDAPNIWAYLVSVGPETEEAATN